MYELPFGREQEDGFGNWAKPVDWAFGGWSVEGITRLQTGAPFNVTVGQDRANVGRSQQRPNVVRNPNNGGNRNVDIPWFDTSAFQLQPIYTYGNAGSFITEADGRQNWDIAFQKDFRFWREGNFVQFRTEMFNYAQPRQLWESARQLCLVRFRQSDLRHVRAADSVWSALSVLNQQSLLIRLRPSLIRRRLSLRVTAARVSPGTMGQPANAGSGHDRSRRHLQYWRSPFGCRRLLARDSSRPCLGPPRDPFPVLLPASPVSTLVSRKACPPTAVVFRCRSRFCPAGADVFHGLNQRLPTRRLRRTVTTFHDLFVLTGDYSTPEFRRRFADQARRAAAESDRIIAVSAFTATQVEQLLGVERSRIRVVHHGVRIPPAGATRAREDHPARRRNPEEKEYRPAHRSLRECSIGLAPGAGRIGRIRRRRDPEQDSQQPDIGPRLCQRRRIGRLVRARDDPGVSFAR